MLYDDKKSVNLHGPLLRNVLVDSDSFSGHFVRRQRQGGILRDVRSQTDGGRLKFIDVLSRIDVDDSSLDILVHDAICSIARSSVFAQRHETAACMWFSYLSTNSL